MFLNENNQVNLHSKRSATDISIKTIFLALVFLLGVASTASAQCYPETKFKKGDIEVDIGVGLINTFIDQNTEAPIPPLSLNVHYRFKKTLSLGVHLGYSKTNYSPDINLEDDPAPIPEVTNNYFLAGLRFDGHFSRDRFDFYGGAMLGYNFSINQFNGLATDRRLGNIVVDEYADIFIFSGHIGAKYLIIRNFGIFGEIGGGRASIISVGLTTKI